MIIKLKYPEGTTIESRYEGNDRQYKFGALNGLGVAVKSAWLCDEVKCVFVGDDVVVPYSNIAYIVESDV